MSEPLARRGNQILETHFVLKPESTNAEEVNAGERMLESKCTECTRRVQASAHSVQVCVQAILCSPLRAQQAQQALCFGLAKLFVQIIALFPPQQRSVSLRNFRLPGTLRTGQGYALHSRHCMVGTALDTVHCILWH